MTPNELGVGACAVCSMGVPKRFVMVPPPTRGIFKIFKIFKRFVMLPPPSFKVPNRQGSRCKVRVQGVRFKIKIKIVPAAVRTASVAHVSHKEQARLKRAMSAFKFKIKIKIKIKFKISVKARIKRRAMSASCFRRRRILFPHPPADKVRGAWRI